MENHGLLSILTHPDYLVDSGAQSTYRALLAFLAELESEHQVWIALPNHINEWWRQRSKMSLVSEAGGWRIEGPGKERARLALAKLDGDRLVYTVASVSSVGRSQRASRPAALGGVGRSEALLDS